MLASLIWEEKRDPDRKKKGARSPLFKLPHVLALLATAFTEKIEERANVGGFPIASPSG